MLISITSYIIDVITQIEMNTVTLDTPLLAEKYDRVSDITFNNGLILIEKLGIKNGIEFINNTVFAAAQK